MKKLLIGVLMMTSFAASASPVIKSCDTFKSVVLGGQVVNTENWNLKSIIADNGEQFVVVTQGFDYTSPKLQKAADGTKSAMKGSAMYYTDGKSYGIMHDDNEMRTFENCKEVK